jgi:hypothetical protein
VTPAVELVGRQRLLSPLGECREHLGIGGIGADGDGRDLARAGDPGEVEQPLARRSHAEPWRPHRLDVYFQPLGGTRRRVEVREPRELEYAILSVPQACHDAPGVASELDRRWLAVRRHEVAESPVQRDETRLPRPGRNGQLKPVPRLQRHGLSVGQVAGSGKEPVAIVTQRLVGISAGLGDGGFCLWGGHQDAASMLG